MKAKGLVFCGLAAAILCLLAPLAIPFGSLPVTLATLVIYVMGGFLKPRHAFCALLVYIALGCLGLPVFAGFSGGAGHIAGPNGGFVIGYIPLLAFVCTGYKALRAFVRVLCMIFGTLALYLVGNIWYCSVMSCDFVLGLLITVVPFLIPDALKIAAAFFIIGALRQNIKKY